MMPNIWRHCFITKQVGKTENGIAKLITTISFKHECVGFGIIILLSSRIYTFLQNKIEIERHIKKFNSAE